MSKDIKKLRREIDSIDLEIAKLFEKRMTTVKGIAEYKQANNIEIFDSSREEAVISKNLSKINDEKIKPYYREFLIYIMKVSKKYQSDILNIGLASKTKEACDE